jgi:hypothetical protein
LLLAHLPGAGLEPTQHDQADEQAENPQGDVLKCLHVDVWVIQFQPSHWPHTKSPK